MAVVWVRLHGSLPSHCAEEGTDREDGIPVTFPQEKVNVTEIFNRLDISEDVVSFVAINGFKGAKDAWLKDGDKVTIFPYVTGG